MEEGTMENEERNDKRVSLEELMEKQKAIVDEAESEEAKEKAIKNLEALDRMWMNRARLNQEYDVEMAKVDKMEDRSDKKFEKIMDIYKVGVASGLYLLAMLMRHSEKAAALDFEATGEYNGMIRSNSARNALNDRDIQIVKF
jgi:hypothetical protein